jgi:hypothetical protein
MLIGPLVNMDQWRRPPEDVGVEVIVRTFWFRSAIDAPLDEQAILGGRLLADRASGDMIGMAEYGLRAIPRFSELANSRTSIARSVIRQTSENVANSSCPERDSNPHALSDSGF